MATPPRVFSLNVSPGGVPKHPVREALVTVHGLSGDAQRNKKLHGGPERALCLYSLERILALQEEGHFVHPGALGENVTVVGIDWSTVVPGARLQLGVALIEVASYAIPCRTIADAFKRRRMARVGQKGFPGWSRVYARVLREGSVRVADVVTLYPPESAVLQVF